MDIFSYNQNCEIHKMAIIQEELFFRKQEHNEYQSYRFEHLLSTRLMLAYFSDQINLVLSQKNAGQQQANW